MYRSANPVLDGAGFKKLISLGRRFEGENVRAVFLTTARSRELTARFLKINLYRRNMTRARESTLRSQRAVVREFRLKAV